MRFSKLAAQKARLLFLEACRPKPAVAEPAEEPDPRPEMICFRAQTLAIVRHYFELSSQLGRLPSLMGREFFRARVTHRGVPSFEDQIVFTRDVELCISRLTADHQEIVMLAGLYNFTHEEVAEMLHISKTSVHVWFAEALDALSEIFLAARILREDRADRRQRQPMRGPLRTGAGARNKTPRRAAFPIAEEATVGALC